MGEGWARRSKREGVLWGWHVSLFILISGTRGAKQRHRRSSYSSPLLRRYPLTKLVHQRLAPAPPSLYSLQHSRTNCVKDTQVSPYSPFIFAASCRSRNSKFARKRVRVPSCSFPHFFFSPVSFFVLFLFTHLRGTNPHHLFHAIDPPVVLCGPQLASMLGCWAATKDVKSIGACREHAQALFECMRTAVRLLSSFCFVSLQGPDDFSYCARQPMKRKQHRPSINYHLARLGKTLKD